MPDYDLNLIDMVAEARERATMYTGLTQANWNRMADALESTAARLREAEAALTSIEKMLPGPRTWAESLSRDFDGKLFPRTIDSDEVAVRIALYRQGKAT